MRSSTLSFVWYPAGMALAIVMYALMLTAGSSTAVAVYAPVVLVALAIVVLELRFPERTTWRPAWGDVKADAAFMVFVQVILPRALLAGVVLGIAQWQHERGPDWLWPHAWPLAAQVVCMVLIVDFFRYWLHRACHRYLPLWRLHEVHHSPEILYALNVGRFHPLEKVLHFGVDTVPFLLLGVAPEVIGGYFLLYAINGLFQHSNVRLRYGWLNHVVGSAETHRWHHARDPKTASCNFGNTTLVWDQLFGTWHLPRGQAVDDIGIMDKAYPKDFLTQMLAPFSRPGGARPRRLRTLISDLLIPLQLRLTHLSSSRRIAVQVRAPMAVQRAVLARLIAQNRDTTFGRKHGFAAITSYEEFRQRVPVGDYEPLRPFVDAEITHGERALTTEAPVRYVRTSGTTGKPKDIPLTPSYLAALRRIHRTSVAYQHRTCPKAFSGKILALVAPAFEGALANGKPFGSASGIVAGDTSALVLEKFVVPRAVLALPDPRLKYLLILRLAIARRDVTYLGSANSTTLLTMIKLYREHASALIEDVDKGTFFLAREIAPEVEAAIRTRMFASPVRAAELAAMHARTDAPRIADLWPDLQLVVTWTCASAGITLAALRRELAPQTRVLELGYLSSEFRGTVTLGKRSGSGLPTLDTHFYEFVERSLWDAGEPAYLTLDQLRKGVDYYIIVTTPSGLYRYFINDLVRVTGFLHATPLLRFQQKGKGVTNITGEKLYESQVLRAVDAAMSELGAASRFVMMLADEVERRYELYVEVEGGTAVDAQALATSVDRKLGELNIEYRAKRESTRLGDLGVGLLRPQTGEAFKQHCVDSGQREGQFKAIALAYRKDFRFAIDAFVKAPPP